MNLNKTWLVWGLVGLGTLAAAAIIFWLQLNSAVEETTDNETAIANSIPPQVGYRKIAEGFSEPVDIATTYTASDSKLYIVEKRGVVKILGEDGQILDQDFLDIERNVLNNGERGLLGLAFHPKYEDNGKLYINYVRAKEGDKPERSIVAEFTRSKADENRVDATSYREVLVQEQPYANHNGGDLAFGLDGYLYIPFGDGGSANDPQQRAQNLSTWLGKILRIDPDGDPYSVPDDNPFTGRNNAKSEIWSYGWRNPWRISFDHQTGNMYVGDVGQSTYEEINREEPNKPGLNYGWDCREGDEIFERDSCRDTVAYTAPYLFYGHEGSQCSGSVTGGFVYRGSTYPKLDGYYFYADYCHGRLYIADSESSTAPFIVDVADFKITSFGEDSNKELYFANAAEGAIYQVISN